MRTGYDLIVVGGGLGGAALAKGMAEVHITIKGHSR
jgi:choline dehydrogenase-like flavoprotein